MTSQVLNSARKYGKARFIDTASASYDVLYPKQHESIRAPIVLQKGEVSVTQKAVAGSKWKHLLSQDSYNAENFLKVNLSAPTGGNYCEYVGLCLVERILIKNTVTLEEFDYVPVMENLLAHMSENRRNEILTLSGGLTHNSGEVIVPLPCFWSALTYHEDDEVIPLPVHLVKSSVEFEITFRDIADIRATGVTGGGIVSVDFVTLTWETTDAMRDSHSPSSFSYKGINWLTQVLDTVPTATSTKIDVSYLTGDILEVALNTNLVSDISTTHKYYKKQQLDELKLRIGNADYLDDLSNFENRYQSLMLGYNGTPAVSNFGSIQMIPFSKSIGISGVNYEGSFNATDLNQIDLIVKHSRGADVYVNVLGRSNATWVIESGHFLRVD